MILKKSNNSITEMLSYIGDNYSNCLYLYLDLKQYGLESSITSGYIQTNDKKINAIMLIYHSCLHIFSRNNDFDVNELVEFIKCKNITIIYCSKNTADRIYERIIDNNNDNVTRTNGWVAQIKEIDRPPIGIAVRAEKNDFEELARMIYEDDDIGRSYDYNDLLKQLEERNTEKFARNMVIKQDNKVIAHACTNAEIEKIAVVAELLVKKEYRRQGYGLEIWRDLCGQLLSENFEVYSFYYSEESRSLHSRVGFNEVCEWSKIVLC